MGRSTLGLLMALGLFGTAVPSMAAERAVAIFAGGCFWCVESDFDKVPGVISTTSGYIGGKVANPTYRQVSSGGTGHTEAVEVVYDPDKISYQKLVDFFWRTIDPTVKDRQFCDIGDQYRTAIFYGSESEKKIVQASMKDVEAHLKKPILTEILPSATFYKAEDYHQDYYLKNSAKYKYYRWSCGRDQRLQALWGKPGGS